MRRFPTYLDLGFLLHQKRIHPPLLTMNLRRWRRNARTAGTSVTPTVLIRSRRHYALTPLPVTLIAVAVIRAKILRGTYLYALTIFESVACRTRIEPALTALPH